MKKERKGEGNPIAPRSVVALVFCILLFGNTLAFLILLISGMMASLTCSLTVGIVASVLLLLGMAVYGLLKRFALSKFWRRLLLGALWCNGGIMLFLAAQFLSLVWYLANI